MGSWKKGRFPLPVQDRQMHDACAMANKIHSDGRAVRVAMFVVGILLGLTAGLLLFLDVIESGWAIVVLIVGIGLISASQATSSAGSIRD